jgi:hypothetical protein
VLAGWSRRSPRRPERTYADACLRGPHADLSLRAEAGGRRPGSLAPARSRGKPHSLGISPGIGTA